MERILKILVIIFLGITEVNAQVVGTPYMAPTGIGKPLDLTSELASFAFSTRKLRASYTGFAMRVRNASNGAEANVAFDTNEEVSSTSTVTYAVAGTSGQAVGSTTTLSNFKGSAQLFVSIWYDQSTSGRNAQQTSTANQPELLLATQNNHAVLSFNGARNIPVTATAIQLLGTTSGGVQGVVGTFLLLTRITGTTEPNSFGLSDPNNRRFQSHLNWANNDLYWDAGETCCAGVRAFNNTAGFNTWKQYVFQRQDLIKIVRVSGVERMNGNGNVAAQPSTTHFGIGATNSSVSQGHIGQISEAILFNKALTTAQLNSIEISQIVYWGAN